MSYDIRFIIHPTTAPDIEVDLPDLDLNITYNLSKLFQALPIGDLNQLDNRLASDIEEAILESIHQLKEFPQYYEAYESPNGWGTLPGAISFLEAFYKACKKHPYAAVRVD